MARLDRFKRYCSIVLTAMVCATPALAQESDPDLDRQRIRQFYVDTYAPLAPLPDLALKAFIAAEDRNFPDSAPEFSTITRAVADRLADPSNGLGDHAGLALRIGAALSRDEIINAYVQGVFLGQDCFGARDAAQAYFGHSIESLSPGDLAFLAALAKAPARVHPSRAPDLALESRNFVLREMVAMGALTLGQAQAAQVGHLTVSDPLGSCAPK